MDIREVYRLEANGEILCLVTAEVPTFVPAVTLETPWIKLFVTQAVSSWFNRRAA